MTLAKLTLSNTQELRGISSPTMETYAITGTKEDWIKQAMKEQGQVYNDMTTALKEEKRPAEKNGTEPPDLGGLLTRNLAESRRRTRLCARLAQRSSFLVSASSADVTVWASSVGMTHLGSATYAGPSTVTGAAAAVGGAFAERHHTPTAGFSKAKMRREWLLCRRTPSPAVLLPRLETATLCAGPRVENQDIPVQADPGRQVGSQAPAFADVQRMEFMGKFLSRYRWSHKVGPAPRSGLESQVQSLLDKVR